MTISVAERLQKGKQEAKGVFVPWHCRRGHIISAHPDAVAVLCGICSRDSSYTGTCQARRVDQFPNWNRRK